MVPLDPTVVALVPPLATGSVPVISVVRLTAAKEGVIPPWRIWVELPAAVWERTPEELA